LRNGYRLPTEAEWAWAARFAHLEAPLVFPWSADPAAVAPTDRSGNFADVSAAKILATSLYTYNDDYPVTAPVGQFEPNAAGIYDMGGNVEEWVNDFYALDLVSTAAVVEDPLGPTSGGYHVVRGSSWRSATLTDLRIAARGYANAARDDLGFRIARNLQ
jgi:formylglycine-generating enzyme required for sulfatase activity